LAVFAITWFWPFSLASLWLLRSAGWGRGVQWQRSRRLFRTALTLNLIAVVCMLWLSWIVFSYMPRNSPSGTCGRIRFPE